MNKKIAFSIVLGAMALGIGPDRVVQPSAWAAENLVVADGPQAGNKWDPELTPYLPEILDNLGIDSPHNLVTIKKSGQVGLTNLGMAWIGSIIDTAPAKSAIIFPTDKAVGDFNSEKFDPIIQATKPLAKKVTELKGQSGGGSTAKIKKFPGGSLALIGANSTADLRSKTLKNIFCDEIDEWPLQLKGQGDPMEMVDARQIAFHASGDYKKLECSTPTIKGISRIDASFENGDQRFWMVICPHCEHEQTFIFKNLKFNKEHPYSAFYACAGNGCVIEHHQKAAMIKGGRWVATNPGPGRHPSYFINSLSSLLTTWDHIAKKFLDSKDDPQKLKTFTNLWLGECWEERGEAPEWKRLLVRRDNYPPRRLPAGALVITTAVDVQGNGVFFEVLGHGDEKRTWSIDVGFLEGDTGDPNGEVWNKLTKLYEREYSDAYGGRWRSDLMGVDSGYNTNNVYLWVRGKPKAMALKGMPGWYAPPLGTPTKQDINFDGQKLKHGVLLWPVGTWSLKAELYSSLRKEGKKDGAEIDPAGYSYFSSFHDESYFKQLTAEYLKEVEKRGRITKEWVTSGPNHFHDCRVYNMALASYLQIGVMDDADWLEIKRERGVPPENPQGDLLENEVRKVARKEPPKQPEATADSAASPQQSGSNFLNRRTSFLG